MKKATLTLFMLVAFSYLYHANSKDMIKVGEKYGRLTVNDFFVKSNRRYAVCKCDCGNEAKIPTGNLSSGNTKSCGCYRNTFKITHGLSNHKLKHIWSAIKDRCYNHKNQRYINYGLRGISICDEWKDDLNAFYEWSMSSGYVDGLTIERINNNGNYDPSNCKWATYAEQASNKTQNVVYTVDGVTKHLNAWARFYGLSPSTLQKRIKKFNGNIELSLYTRDESYVRYRDKSK